MEYKKVIFKKETVVPEGDFCDSGPDHSIPYTYCRYLCTYILPSSVECVLGFKPKLDEKTHNYKKPKACLKL